MKSSKVLVVGSRGLLGTATLAAFASQENVQAVGFDLPELDITDAARVRGLVDEVRPDLIVNCAAYTRVDDCETNEAPASRVNGEGAGLLADSAAKRGSRFIHISTDYVFDGGTTEPYREDHPLGDPLSLCAYGRSKHLGEQLVRDKCPGSLIVRTAWMFGPDGPGFPQAILQRARAGEPLRVVDDQVGTPTYAPDLAEALTKHRVTNSRCIIVVEHFKKADPPESISGLPLARTRDYGQTSLSYYQARR